jgi:hypothetical protein
VTEECQPQVHPPCEALDAEAPTCIAGSRRGEQVCFCPIIGAVEISIKILLKYLMKEHSVQKYKKRGRKRDVQKDRQTDRERYRFFYLKKAEIFVLLI